MDTLILQWILYMSSGMKFWQISFKMKDIWLHLTLPTTKRRMQYLVGFQNFLNLDSNTFGCVYFPPVNIQEMSALVLLSNQILIKSLSWQTIQKKSQFALTQIRRPKSAFAYKQSSTNTGLQLVHAEVFWKNAVTHQDTQCPVWPYCKWAKVRKTFMMKPSSTHKYDCTQISHLPSTGLGRENQPYGLKWRPTCLKAQG